MGTRENVPDAASHLPVGQVYNSTYFSFRTLTFPYIEHLALKTSSLEYINGSYRRPFGLNHASLAAPAAHTAHGRLEITRSLYALEYHLCVI